jgi:hypothetical protein
MAIGGYGGEYDITCKLDASLKTTTSQYAVVGMVPGSTTSADFTVCLCGQTSTMADATAASYNAIGILQSYQSSGSENGTVRLFGVSKAVCAESIPAGAFVMAYYGISTTTMPGKVVYCHSGGSTTAATTSITVYTVVLGRALSNGSTNSVISVFVNPQLYDMALVGSIGIT